MSEAKVPNHLIWAELRRMEAEGLVTVFLADDGQPTARLTDKGRAYAAQRQAEEAAP